MRTIHHVVLLTALAISTCGLTACSGGFDPDKLDIFGLSEKKKLPGERKDVFPQGVPGVPQGVPPDLMKGNQPPPDATAPPPPAAVVSEPPVVVAAAVVSAPPAVVAGAPAVVAQAAIPPPLIVTAIAVAAPARHSRSVTLIWAP